MIFSPTPLTPLQGFLHRPLEVEEVMEQGPALPVTGWRSGSVSLAPVESGSIFRSSEPPVLSSDMRMALFLMVAGIVATLIGGLLS